MKLSARSLCALSSLGLCIAVGGAASAQQQTPPLRRVPGFQHPGAAPAPEPPQQQSQTPHGLVQLIGEALSDVTLKPDQRKAVEELGSRVEPLQAAVDKAENKLLLGLADEIGSAHPNRAALDPLVGAFVDARKAESPALRQAFEGLHKTLDPQQRAQFSDSLGRRFEDLVHVESAASRLDTYQKQLALTDEQKQAIGNELKKYESAAAEEHAKAKQAIEAFKGDTFSLESMFPERDVAESAKAKANRIVDSTEAILRILTPEQRAKAAQRLRDAVNGRAIEQAPPAAPAQQQQKSGGGPELKEGVGVAEQDIWGARGGYVRGGRVGGFGGYGRFGSAGYVSASRYGYSRSVGYPFAGGLGVGW